MFRKPKVAPVRRRKLSTSEDNEASPKKQKIHKEGGNEESGAGLAISEVKLLQKFRQKPKGVPLSVEEGKGDDAEIETYAEEEHLLDRNFEVQGERQNDKVDPHLEAFLAERLGNDEKKQHEEREATKKLNSSEDSLYAIPEALQVDDKTHEHAEKMNWVTGLVEVSLPIEYKLKNIEETEKAKREMLQLGSAYGSGNERGVGSGNVEGGVSGNPDVDAVVRKKAFGSRFLNWERPKSSTATDDQALDRFRKRFRR